ncbi:MAG: MBL fold metallo-hydrolase, partial [Chloroflexota bacterium]
NTYAVITAEGRALFLDYGFPSFSHFSANTRFVEHSLGDLRRLAGLKVIDAVMPSHYHDDHVCGLQYLCDHHGARLWVFENQEDILAHPEAYNLPRLWRRRMTPSRVFADGETFRWEGISFTAARTPGHTEYACAISFEIDGRRIVHAGDTLGRGMAGATLGGPVFRNGFSPGDFLTSVTRLREFEPEYLLTGHWGALEVDEPFLDEALRRARALNDILWDLIAVPAEAGFSFDPNWATLYPYQMTVMADEPTPIEVRIVNHLSADAVATASLRLPAGWICDPPDGEITIARSGRAALPFLVTAPPRTNSGERHTIAAEITLNGRSFGPVAEGIAMLG